MEHMIKLLSVLGLGAVELWAAIPAGFVLKLNPLEMGIPAASGAILGVLVVLVLGERIRTRLLLNRKNEDKKHGPASGIATGWRGLACWHPSSAEPGISFATILSISYEDT